MAYQMDFFAASSESKVLAAIQNSRVQYPAYVFIRNEDGVTGKLAFVDQNNVLKYICCDNKTEDTSSEKQIVNVDELPVEGNVEVIYICKGVAYIFDGTDFVALGKDHTAELEALTNRVSALETSSANVLTKLESLETEVGSINEQITDLENTIEKSVSDLDEKSKNLYEKVKYEIADAPVGTLVDYREKEIRIMCPTDAEWKKQAVGTGGDANSYYVTFKTYVPNDDVVGYIEHLGDQVDSEILTTFSTDKYGRRYQPTWLAVAKYDESTETWTYHGTRSTTNKYLGWDYQIDWYNADGIVIASDKIRINLSNEECHFITEPYYLVALKAEVETLKESNAKVIEDLETITEEVTKFEDRINFC